jgi:hypothetical protein
MGMDAVWNVPSSMGDRAFRGESGGAYSDALKPTGCARSRKTNARSKAASLAAPG